MAVIEVTSRLFRDKQKTFLDMADSGKEIVIMRGRKQAYKLIPVDNEDLYFTAEMIEKIEHSRQQAISGKVTRVSSVEELDKFLDSL